jgi:hypothetical protein
VRMWIGELPSLALRLSYSVQDTSLVMVSKLSYRRCANRSKAPATPYSPKLVEVAFREDRQLRTLGNSSHSRGGARKPRPLAHLLIRTPSRLGSPSRSWFPRPHSPRLCRRCRCRCRRRRSGCRARRHPRRSVCRCPGPRTAGHGLFPTCRR